MTKVLNFLKGYPQLCATLIAGGCALILTGAGFSHTRWLVTAFVLVIALIQLIGMIGDILKGSWGIDILAITAISATVVVGEYWAALVVCLMLSGGEALEDFAAARARSQLSGLLGGAPDKARLVCEDGTFKEIPVADVHVGATILIRPGEIVPIDAQLLSENAVIDESSLTGEPIPITVEQGAQIPSGGINGEHAITAKTLKPAAQSQYQRIVELVRKAQESKAPVVRLADRVAVPFTIFAFIVAGLAWWLSGDVTRLAQVLVVATPCPLLIAAPVAFLAGMNRAAKSGIIVKDSGTLESLSRVKTVAMDKTGTLTWGRPHLVNTTDNDELLAIAAAIEAQSTHALAQAITQAAVQRGIAPKIAIEVRETVGSGVSGIVEGKKVFLGKAKAVAEIVGHQVINPAQPGHILIHIAVEGKYRGYLDLADQIRPSAACTVAKLHELGVRKVVMLTGDSSSTANAVAHEIGIDSVRADLRPQDKAQIVARHLDAPVAMVGDGVNDAPVLAVAQVGIAMGARGSSAASESADVVIMQDDIGKAAKSIAIGKRTMEIARQSIGIGVGLSIILMIVGASGVMPAVVGAFMQEFVDLACILWALLAARAGRNEVLDVPTLLTEETSENCHGCPRFSHCETVQRKAS